MGYFQVRYDSRVIIYDRRGFIRLATGGLIFLDLFDFVLLMSSFQKWPIPDLFFLYLFVLLNS